MVKIFESLQMQLLVECTDFLSVLFINAAYSRVSENLLKFSNFILFSKLVYCYYRKSQEINV